MKNTTFIISGGAGRVVTAIPALEKYNKLNPDDDFKVLVDEWQALYWSHPILQNRTFGHNQKGQFENHIKNYRVVVPEPYTTNSFFNQKTNLVECFDEIINNTDDHSDLALQKYLYTSAFEKLETRRLFDSYIEHTGKQKIVVIQPFGSGAKIINNTVIDNSNRSLSRESYLKIVEELSRYATVLYVSPPQFRHPNDTTSIAFDENYPYMCFLSSFIEQCDYFVGVCSVGQHIAKAFKKPGTIFMGGTHERSFSYPEHFQIVRTEGRTPIYSPWRLSNIDCDFANLSNEGIMNFTDKQLVQTCNFIEKKLTNTSQWCSNYD